MVKKVKAKKEVKKKAKKKVVNMCEHVRYETIDNGYEDWDGDWHEDWRMVPVSTTVDVDLHRYKCTQCGEMFYYSGRARDYYEKGKRSPGIEGLE